MPVLIRPAIASDLPPLTDLYNHYIRETPITFDLEPYSVDRRRQTWFEHYHCHGPHRLLVAEIAGQPVGYASSSAFGSKAAFATSVETSIYLNPSVQHQGIGTQLYAALFAALACEPVHRAYALITLPNSHSIALHEKLGFQAVGVCREVGRKFDRYWDVAWYERALP